MADLPSKLHLTVVTREKKLLDVEADEVNLPAALGYLGVLPGHTPLLTTLRIGALSYREGGREHQFVLTWGFAEILPDRVIVLADEAFEATDIDVAVADRERMEAERELASLSSHDESFAMAEAKLEKSIAKIQVASQVTR